MKYYDCFMYNNENLILKLRLNFLNPLVEKFIIVESKYDHQGKLKNKFFDINEFFEFKEKIIYLLIENFPVNLSNWERENFQRNSILECLKDISDEDYVMISDVDEIPNIKNISQINNYKYTVFEQKNYFYKFNLMNATLPKWYGTKMCKKKYLKTPQWLRDQKVKKFSIFKFYKIKWNIIKNGGWHFSFLMSPEEIQKKIKSFAHAEFNIEKFTNLKGIEDRINNKKDIFDRDQKYKIVQLDESFPDYINKNLEKLKEWVL